MALDPSIFAALGTRPKSALEYLQEMAAMEDAGQRRESNRLALLTQRGQYEDQMAARDRGNRLREAMQALGPNATLDQRIGVADSVGDFGAGDALRTRQQAETKARDESYKARAEIAGKFLSMQRDLAGFVMANPTRENAALAIQRMQALAQSLGQEADFAQELSSIAQLQTPDDVKRWAAGHALQAEKLLPQLSTRNLGGTTETMAADPVTGQVRVTNVAKNTQSPDSAASVAATIRGQNMTDARAREGLAQAESQFNRKLAAEGEKPLNDAQSKALLFGSRMQEADKVIGGLIAGGTKTPSLIKQGAEAVPGVGPLLGMGANKFIASDEQQQLEQAQRDFINATLRRESGAVISDSEFANARQQYFPQPGDAPAVIKQKAKNRKLATQGILAEVPEKKRSSLSTNTGGASGSWGDGSGWKIEKAE